MALIKLYYYYYSFFNMYGIKYFIIKILIDYIIEPFID